MIKLKVGDLSLGKEVNCPAATQDLKLNTKNRDASIKSDHIQYGPLSVDEPGDYWKDIAKHWDATEEAAKKSLCGNCVAFDISPRMDECMPGETSDDDGRLGYCWMHHFKCHSARSCYTWAKGGPIEDDDVSADWQERNKKSLEERKKAKKKSSGKKDACYYKVKSRYKVWPSAYASGAVVQCRKVGAKNWGKSKKNENIEEAIKLTLESNLSEKKKRKKRKLTKKPSSETSLRDWFKRKGTKGSKSGWVDCNAPDGKGGYKACGRSKGEKRSKYPACRPTPGACKNRNKSWGKKARRGMKESRDLNFVNHSNIVNLMQEMFGDKIIIETQEIETKRGTTLRLPRFQINEKDWGQRVNTKDRSTIELIGSQLKGDTPLTRVAFAQEFLNDTETVKERITVGQVMASLMFLDLFSSVVNNFNEAVAGFLFEALFAGIFEGKQIPAKEADTTTDAILRVKYRGGPEDVPYSFKLLTKGGTVIGGSVFDLFNGVCKEGKEIYLVGLKSGESPKIGIELYEFPIDRENWFALTAKPKMTTEQLFEYEPLDIQNIVQSGQVPEIEVLNRNNQKIKFGLTAITRGRLKAKEIVGFRTSASSIPYLYIEDGEDYKLVKGTEKKPLPLDGEYFIKKSTGEKKIAMPTGKGLNSYAPFVQKGTVREGFKEAVGKYFEEFIADPAAVKEKESLIFDREKSPLNLAPAFQKQSEQFAVTQDQLMRKDPALRAEGPATLVLDKQKFTEAANAYADKVGQEIYDLFTNLANLVDDVSGYFLTANQGERNKFAKDSKESSKKLAQSAEENLVEVESNVMAGIVLNPAPASNTPSKQDAKGGGTAGYGSQLKATKESKDSALKENKSIKLKMNRPTTLKENLEFHLENNITMDKSVLRFGSDSHIKLIKETKQLWEQGRYFATTEEKELFQTDIGEYSLFEGKTVALDVPMLNEDILDEKKKKKKKNPPLNKPSLNAGSGKKWKVYVRSKSGGVKKVTFGDKKGGLKGNWNDPEARKSFAARHKCADKKNKTKAGYWACRAHKYFGKNVPGRFW